MNLSMPPSDFRHSLRHITLLVRTTLSHLGLVTNEDHGRQCIEGFEILKSGPV